MANCILNQFVNAILFEKVCVCVHATFNMQDHYRILLDTFFYFYFCRNKKPLEVTSALKIKHINKHQNILFYNVVSS